MLQVIKQAADLTEGVSVLETGGDQDQLEMTRDQLANINTRRDGLLRQAAHLETEMSNKRRQLAKAK